MKFKKNIEANNCQKVKENNPMMKMQSKNLLHDFSQ